jgi:hypothetical protein
MHKILKLSVMLLILAAAVRAEARPVRFLGPHPIAARHGRGYCYIEAPHFHDYAPDHQALYQQVDGSFVFTGDPTPFGYDGERYRYQGHHPVVVDGAVEPVYCVIDGPHVHEYAPPPGPEFVVQNGVAVYTPPIPPVYVTPHRVRVVNAEYRPLLMASGPSVVASGPGIVVGAPSVEVSAPSVQVSAPGIVVGAPPPVIVAPPSVVVEPPHPVFVAPRPVVVGAPGVVVGAPGVVVGAPGVVVGAPGPVYVGGPRYEHEGHWGRHGDDDDQGGGHWHHDNGKHKGWYK